MILSEYHKYIFEAEYNEKPSSREDKEKLVVTNENGFKGTFTFDNLRDVIQAIKVSRMKSLKDTETDITEEGYALNDSIILRRRSIDENQQSSEIQGL